MYLTPPKCPNSVADTTSRKGLRRVKSSIHQHRRQLLMRVSVRLCIKKCQLFLFCVNTSTVLINSFSFSVLRKGISSISYTSAENIKYKEKECSAVHCEALRPRLSFRPRIYVVFRFLSAERNMDQGIPR